MSFLAPAFLVGLLALAVPVIIHLIQRERVRTVQFPSLMFLRRIPYQSVRRRRIRHWLLLAMRLAALALIVAAFARPFVRRPGLSAASAVGAREVVILLDQSYSMGYANRWDRARSAASDVVRGLAQGDRASLVVFSTGAEMVVRSATDRGQLQAAVGATNVGAGATRFGPALKLAHSVLAESRAPNREVVLVSDFQRNGWKREDAVRFTSGTTFRPVSVADATTSNLTVLTVNLERSSFSGQERLSIRSGLINRAKTPVTDLPVLLEIDDRTVQTVRTSLEANGSASVSFAPVTLPSKGLRGTVRIDSDDLARDNAFHFVAAPAEQVPVIVVERSNAGRESSLYLARALGVGRMPAFKTTIKPVEELRAETLAEPRVVVLNDVPVSPDLAGRLRRFVEGGGGVLLVLGARSSWPADNQSAWLGTIGPAFDRAEGRGGTLTLQNYSHPVFDLFRAPRSGDFSVARIFRYRGFTLPATGNVLAQYDDGGMALGEVTAGEGHVMVWSSTLDNSWNDLVVKPVFVPFVDRLARYLARFKERESWFVVSQVVDPADLGPPASPGVVGARSGRSAEYDMALTPSGRQLSLNEADRGGLLELNEQGFYELRRRRAETARPQTLAVNVDTAESDLTPMDPQELAAAVTGRGRAEAVATAVSRPEDEERRQAVWWYLLLTGMVLLGLETALSNRLSRIGV